MSTENATREWYPCEHPERPNDALMVWHYDCHGCFTAAIATSRRLEHEPNVEPIVTSALRSLLHSTKPREPLSFADFLRWEAAQ